MTWLFRAWCWWHAWELRARDESGRPLLRCSRCWRVKPYLADQPREWRREAA